MNGENDTKINSDERFVRWQKALRESISFINNVLLTISIGIVGFIISLLDNPNFNPTCCQKIFFTLGLILSFLSILLGLGAAFSRLLDYRITLKKIKNELKNTTHAEIEDLKKQIKCYEKTTWFLLYSQITTLIIGIVNLVISFCWIYYDKLF